MIILLDIEKQILSLYSADGQVNIPLKDAYKLYSYLEEDTVYYITNVVEVNADDVIKVVQSMGINVNIPAQIQETGMKYIHTVKDGTVCVDEKIKFNGKFDIRPYDEEMQHIVLNNHTLQQLIKNKIIEIIGESKKYRLLEELKVDFEEKEKIRSLVDKGLDSILVDSSISIKEMRKEGSIVIDDGTEEIDDPIPIDIGSTGARTLQKEGEFETMSDFMKAVNETE